MLFRSGPGRTLCLGWSSPSDDLLQDGLFRACLRTGGTAHLSGSACSRSDICERRKRTQSSGLGCRRASLQSRNGFRRQVSRQCCGMAHCFGSRSEERRGGKEWVSTCRSRGSPSLEKKKIKSTQTRGQR